jgi:AraC-like DNA-binding protein
MSSCRPRIVFKEAWIEIMTTYPPLVSSRPLNSWASLRSELLWIYEGEGGSEKLPLSHIGSEAGCWAWLARKGSIRISIRNQEWEINEGQWGVSTTDHGPLSPQIPVESKVLALHFRCQWPTGENFFANRNFLLFNASEIPDLERYGNALIKCIQRHFPGINLLSSTQQSDLNVFFQLQRHFIQWLGAFSENITRHGNEKNETGLGDERLLKAANILRRSITQGIFPSKEILTESSLGRAHLDRLFWQEFGTTTREYWERMRENSIREILETTQLSIKEIGYTFGFRQPSHFTKWCLRRTGKTPSDYRLNALGGADDPPKVVKPFPKDHLKPTGKAKARAAKR